MFLMQATACGLRRRLFPLHPLPLPETLEVEDDGAMFVLCHRAHFIAFRWLDNQFEINFSNRTHTWQKACVFNDLGSDEALWQDGKGVWHVNSLAMEGIFEIIDHTDDFATFPEQADCQGGKEVPFSSDDLHNLVLRQTNAAATDAAAIDVRRNRWSRARHGRWRRRFNIGTYEPRLLAADLCGGASSCGETDTKRRKLDLLFAKVREDALFTREQIRHNKLVARSVHVGRTAGKQFAPSTTKKITEGLSSLRDGQLMPLLPQLLQSGYIQRSIMPKRPQSWPAAAPEIIDHLQHINDHPRDACLTFDASSHTYFWNGCRVSISATGLIHRFAHSFQPQQAIAAMRSGSNWPRPRYLRTSIPMELRLQMLGIGHGDRLLQMLDSEQRPEQQICDLIHSILHQCPDAKESLLALGKSDDEIKDQWAMAGQIGASKGTWMHSSFECLLNGGFLTEHDEEIALVKAFLASMLPLEAKAFRTEWMVYASDEDLAGSIDFVLRMPNGKLILIDWKRTSEMSKKHCSYGKMMLEPLEKVPDATLWHYRLQLNIYRYIIEKYYSHDVDSMLVVGCNPDNGDVPFVDHVPRMDVEIRALMATMPMQDRLGGSQTFHATLCDVRVESLELLCFEYVEVLSAEPNLWMQLPILQCCEPASEESEDWRAALQRCRDMLASKAPPTDKPTLTLLQLFHKRLRLYFSYLNRACATQPPQPDIMKSFPNPMTGESKRTWEKALRDWRHEHTQEDGAGQPEDVCGGADAAHDAAAQLRHQFCFPVSQGKQHIVWQRLKWFYRAMMPLYPALAEHSHLFWILPNPFMVELDRDAWMLRLSASSFFLKLLQAEDFKLLELALYAFFWPEVSRRPFISDMIFVSNCFSSRADCAKHMAETIHFLHFIWLSDPNFSQDLIRLRYHWLTMLKSMSKGAWLQADVNSMWSRTAVCTQTGACDRDTHRLTSAQIVPDPRDRFNFPVWCLRVHSARLFLNLLQTEQLDFLELALRVFHSQEIETSPRLAELLRTAALFDDKADRSRYLAQVIAVLQHTSLVDGLSWKGVRLSLRAQGLKMVKTLHQRLLLQSTRFHSTTPSSSTATCFDCWGGSSTSSANSAQPAASAYADMDRELEGYLNDISDGTLVNPAEISTPAADAPAPDQSAVPEQNVEDLQIVEKDSFEKVKRRRLMPKAQTTVKDFRDMFEAYSTTNADLLRPGLKETGGNDGNILNRCHNLISYTRARHPTWSEHMIRLGACALACCNARLGNRMFIGDNAFFLWLVEGDRYIRVHSGFCYIYNGNGAFLPYSGIPPQAVLFRVCSFFTQLEGLFRRMNPAVQRREDLILRAIAADAESFGDEEGFLQACNKSAIFQQAPDHEAENGDDAVERGSGWTQKVADLIWKVCQSVRGDMMHDRLISLLVEWCETPRAAKKCVAYEDTCVLYDTTIEIPVRHVPKKADNNCYVYIPHSLLDPVLSQHVRRLQQFYEQTFWANHDVFLCNQAALALAKRGVNVDRCFIGESPGGVGQSLFSAHLDAMLGHNHGFFDPNIWFNEDELRKQVESYARCIVITGQEAPESHKKMHLDLFKKTMSGDGIAGRKPYGYTTRMFSIVGWKRLEVNRMMVFVGIDDSNFQSVFRRALVWKPKARFHHDTMLQNLHADHELDGHFRADPTLKQFLVSAPACAAGLQIQHAFEARFHQDACIKLIDDYATGGDEYLTEDKLRVSCGLKIRARHVDVVDGGVALLEVQCSQDERDQRDLQYKKLRQLIMDALLDCSQSDMTMGEFVRKVTLQGEDLPNINKKQLWKELEDKGLLIKAKRKGTRATDVLQPLLDIKHKLQDIIDIKPCDTATLFLESRNMCRLSQYLAQPTRVVNNDIVMKYLEQCKRKVATRGRKGASAKAVQNDIEERISKFQSYEKVCASFQEGQNPDAFAVDTLDSQEFGYKYADGARIRSRRYVVGSGAQKCAQRIQYHLFPHTMDLDIKNCCLKLTLQLVEKTEPSPSMPEDILAVLQEWLQSRDEVCKDMLQVSTSEGKKIINAVLNGGSPPERLKDCTFVRKMQKASAYLRWFACSLLAEDYKDLLTRDDKAFPSATAFHYMWTAVEDFVLEQWLEFVKQQRPTHVSLHFDGVRVNRDITEGSVESFLRQSEQHIKANTNFSVDLVCKEHSHTQELICNAATKTEDLTDLPDLFVQDGNCVPCALWHLCDNTSQFETIFSSDCPENKYMSERKHRTYKQCSALVGQQLQPCLGLPDPLLGKFVLHAEGKGKGHCVGVSIPEGSDEAFVWNGCRKYTMPVTSFLAAASVGIDRLTVVCFSLTDTCPSAEDSILLDLQAGSLSTDSDSEEAPDSALIVDDEGHCRFEDVIRDSLEEEVNSFMAEIDASNIRRMNGFFRCALCPFRCFNRVSQLRDHVRLYHVRSNQFVCSGTKQMKIVLALHDADNLHRKCEHAFLFRSSQLLRSQVQPPLDGRCNNIDKSIRLLFTANGPQYINTTAIETLSVRRVLNIYYDRSFADVLYREIVLHHSNASWPFEVLWCLI